MQKSQRIINLIIHINGALAGVLCLGSIFLCAGTTIAWFGTAPFVSDRTEVQIQRPILPAATGIGIGLGWATLTGMAAAKWRRNEPIDQVLIDWMESEAQEAIEMQLQEQLDHKACRSCQNYHGQAYGGKLLVCAMHPYGWNENQCPDWSSNESDQAWVEDSAEDWADLDAEFAERQAERDREMEEHRRELMLIRAGVYTNYDEDESKSDVDMTVVDAARQHILNLLQACGPCNEEEIEQELIQQCLNVTEDNVEIIQSAALGELIRSILVTQDGDDYPIVWQETQP